MLLQRILVTLRTYRFVLLTILVISENAGSNNFRKGITSGIYRTGRYPRTARKVLVIDKQHALSFHHDYDTPKTYVKVPKRIGLFPERNKLFEPLDSNRKKYVVNEPLKGSSPRMKVVTKLPNKPLTGDTRTQHKYFNKKWFTELTHKHNPLRQNQEKRTSKNKHDVTGNRKDEISNNKFFHEPFDSDFNPLFGDKRDEMGNTERQSKEDNSKHKDFAQNNVARGNDNNADGKSIEFYLTEKNGQVKLSNGKEAEKLIEQNDRFLQPIDNNINAVGAQTQKFREKEQNDYIKQVINTASDGEENYRNTLAGVPYAEGREENHEHQQHHEPSALHESELEQKFMDRQPEETTYGESQYMAENQKQEGQNSKALTEKIQSFNSLMDKLHRSTATSNGQEEEQKAPQAMEAQQNDNMEPYENQETMQYAPNSQENSPGNFQNQPSGIQKAFQLTKAIISGAKSVDKSDAPSKIPPGGQTLIPEVFEAFSKTNNDLKQKYDMLQKWALTSSTSAPDRELKQQIRNLNELSDMVRLVNNLEKDMLKTILKKRKESDPEGDGMSYKHADIPYNKESNEKEPHRFHNPSDVHDLLQYIYDTYIENRTPDEIPVVLQAFQRSVTDIVRKKSIANKNVTTDSALLSQSISMMNNQTKDQKVNATTSYNLDNDALSNFEFDDLSSQKSFFEQHAGFKDDSLNDDIESKEEKVTKYVKNDESSPVITVKLLKALDLFLDSIEIGRKIKRFRSKVENTEHKSNGTVLFTGTMRHSLGELNQEVQETLKKSNNFDDITKKNTTQEKITNHSSASISSNVKDHNGTVRKEIKSLESYNEKIKALRKALGGDIADDYAGKPYNADGIYYEKHKEDPNYLSYEKEWYENSTGFDKNSHKLNSHIFLENITNPIKNVASIYIDPHSPFKQIPDLDREAMYGDYFLDQKNISKLNKEAMKGQKAYNKDVKKLVKEFHQNDSYHSTWNEVNITQIDKEARKGERYYNKVFNKSAGFDKAVQKIIDNAMTEAKNTSDSLYQQNEDASNEIINFGKLTGKPKKLELNSMNSALNKAHRNVNAVLNENNIDKGTANAAQSYLDQEDQYINNLFYEEGSDPRKNHQRDENSNKKDQTIYNATANEDIKNSNQLRSGAKRGYNESSRTEETKRNRTDSYNVSQSTLSYQSDIGNKLKLSDAKMNPNEAKKIEQGFFSRKNNTNPKISTEIESHTSKDLDDLSENFHSLLGSKAGKLLLHLSSVASENEEKRNETFRSVTVVKNDTANDLDRSAENDYLIKQVLKRKDNLDRPTKDKDNKDKTNDDDDVKLVKAIDSATNFNELEKAIKEIKGDKTSDMVQKVASKPKIENAKEGEADKRNINDGGADYAHKLMEEINKIPFGDNDKSKRKRAKVSKKKLKKRIRVEKRSTISHQFRRKRVESIVNRSKYNKSRPRNNLGKWRGKISRIGSKKNQIEVSKKDTGLKESFLDKLSTSQQKLVWHILKRAYSNNNRSIKLSNEINGNELRRMALPNAQIPRESLNTLFNSFMSEKKDDIGSNTEKKGDVKSKVNENVTVNSLLNETTQIMQMKNNRSSHIEHELPSNMVGPIKKYFLLEDGENEAELLTLKKQKNSNSKDNEKNEENPEYFFKDEKKGSKSVEEESLTRRGNNTIKGDNSSQLPSIMDHLENVTKQMNNESAELMKPFTTSNSNQTTDLKTDEGSGASPCRKENAVITDGDDIFNLPAQQCANEKKDTQNTELDTNVKDTTKSNCKQHFLTFKKNGFTYRIPTLKCVKNSSSQHGGDVQLKISDLVPSSDSESSNNYEDTKEAETANTDCDPIYDTLNDGKGEYKVKVGCKKDVSDVLEPAPYKGTIDNIKKNQENGTVEVLQTPSSTLTKNEKVIYKGKNVMMTQSDLGSEKIMINGSNRMIEINYPPEDDVNGFITLKQGSRLYKIPYRNHSEVDPAEYLGVPTKSEVPWTPDYLRSAMINTETFKVRDTSITKETYTSGAKVITMEKEKASLSIFYPPKNHTKYTDTGYMVLKENGKIYNIPLDGSKTLKKIGSGTFLNSNAFKNSDSRNHLQNQTSPMKEVNVFNGTTRDSTKKDLTNTDMILAQFTSRLKSNSDKDISHIKERRFNHDDFHYQPKSYKVDKFRHQKHLIEHDPREPSRFMNENDRDPNEDMKEHEQDQEQRREEEDDRERRPYEENEEESNDDQMIHRDSPDHPEDVSNFANNEPSAQRFVSQAMQPNAVSSHEAYERRPGVENDMPNTDQSFHQFAQSNVDDEEVPVENNQLISKKQEEPPLQENERFQENDAPIDGPLEPNGPEPGDAPLTKDRLPLGVGVPTEDAPQQGDDPSPRDSLQQGDDPSPRDGLQQVDDPSPRDGTTQPIGDDQPDEETPQQPFLPLLHSNNNNLRNDNDENFFPLRENFASPNVLDKSKNLPKVHSLIVPPQFISGGFGIQDIQNSFNDDQQQSTSDEGNNIFVSGLTSGKNENLRITPVSSSMNPNMNEHNRLEDFTTYATGRSIKSSKKKGTRNIDTKNKLNKFVKEIMSSSMAKQLMTPPSAQFLQKLGSSSMKHMDYQFNHLQKSALRQYMHIDNEKLDGNDKNALRRLGYTDLEFNNINNGIKKRNPHNLHDIGIEVNGEKVGNVNLLLQKIPHVKG